MQLMKELFMKESKTIFMRIILKHKILLIPVVIDLDKSALHAFTDSLDKVKSYGLVIEPFGTESIVVREIPAILSDSDVKSLALDIINELIENNDSSSVEEQINKICSKMACHGSIRAGREMQPNEMNDFTQKWNQHLFQVNVIMEDQHM